MGPLFKSHQKGKKTMTPVVEGKWLFFHTMVAPVVDRNILIYDLYDQSQAQIGDQRSSVPVLNQRAMETPRIQKRLEKT